MRGNWQMGKWAAMEILTAVEPSRVFAKFGDETRLEPFRLFIEGTSRICSPALVANGQTRR